VEIRQAVGISEGEPFVLEVGRAAEIVLTHF
jgi:hypothetical protein